MVGQICTYILATSLLLLLLSSDAFTPYSSIRSITTSTFSNAVSSHQSRYYHSSLILNSNQDGRENDWELQLLSPCKINLFLRILGRRATGYHDLASLFQAISLSDGMAFTKLPKDATEDLLICSDPSLHVDSNNLVIKALNLMRIKTGINQYFKVKLDKNIPMQAGLGGGSGNAATAMFAFNKLTSFPASQRDLKEWSADIGSDITFFFSSGTAYCTGRGEIVETLPSLPETHKATVHVFKPAAGLSTALVFKALNLGATSQVDPANLLAKFVKSGALASAMDGCLINDLEPPAFACQPSLEQLKASIKNLGHAIGGVMMSGSGTSVYALANADEPIEPNISSILTEFPNVKHFKCKFISKKDDVFTWYE